MAVSNVTIAYFGHHRSGSTWIFRVLRELFEEELGVTVLQAAGEDELRGGLAAARERTGAGLVCYTNADFHAVRGQPVRGVHVIRDPRDLLVSAYFAHAHSHPVGGWPELSQFREVLSSSSVEEGLLLELDFCENVFEDMRSWPRAVEGVLEMKFEDLVAHPIVEFRRFVRQFELDPEPALETVDRVVEAHSFDRLSGGRAPGDEDRRNHYRKGQPGDWRLYFSPALRWAFERRYGDLLRRYEYEANDAWSSVKSILTTKFDDEV